MGDSFNPLFSDNKIRLSDNDYEEKLEKRQSLQSVRISSSTDNSLAADIKKSFFHKIAPWLNEETKLEPFQEAAMLLEYGSEGQELLHIELTARSRVCYHLRTKYHLVYRLTAWLLLLFHIFEIPVWTFRRTNSDWSNGSIYPSYGIPYLPLFASALLILSGLLVLWFAVCLEFGYKKHTRNYYYTVAFAIFLSLETIGYLTTLMYAILGDSIVISAAPLLCVNIVLIEYKFQNHLSYFLGTFPKFCILLICLSAMIILYTSFAYYFFAPDSQEFKEWFMNFGTGLWNMLMIFDASDWPSPMIPAMHENRLYVLYFYIFIILFNWGLLNLFLGFVYLFIRVEQSNINSKHAIIKYLYLQTAFQILDIERKDYLTYHQVDLLIEEVYQYYLETMTPPSHEERYELLLELDEEGNGRISWKNFSKIEEKCFSDALRELRVKKRKFHRYFKFKGVDGAIGTTTTTNNNNASEVNGNINSRQQRRSRIIPDSFFGPYSIFSDATSTNTNRDLLSHLTNNNYISEPSAQEILAQAGMNSNTTMQNESEGNNNKNSDGVAGADDSDDAGHIGEIASNHAQKNDLLVSEATNYGKIDNQQLVNRLRSVELMDRLTHTDAGFNNPNRRRFHIRKWISTKLSTLAMYIDSIFFDITIDTILLFLAIIAFASPSAMAWTTFLIYMGFSLLELFLKLIVKGRFRYFKSARNFVDGIITFVLLGILLGMILKKQTYTFSNNYGFQSLVLVRMLLYPRNFIVLKSLVSFRRRHRKAFLYAFQSAGHVAFLSLVMFAMLYGMAAFGVQLFGGRIVKTGITGENISNSYYGQSGYWPLNFNDMPSGIVTMFTLLHVNNMHVTTSGFVASTNDWAEVFFAAWYAVGVLLLLNVLIAVFVNQFAGYLEVLARDNKERNLESQRRKEEQLPVGHSKFVSKDDTHTNNGGTLGRSSQGSFAVKRAAQQQLMMTDDSEISYQNQALNNSVKRTLSRSNSLTNESIDPYQEDDSNNNNNNDGQSTGLRRRKSEKKSKRPSITTQLENIHSFRGGFEDSIFADSSYRQSLMKMMKRETSTILRPSYLPPPSSSLQGGRPSIATKEKNQQRPSFSRGNSETAWSSSNQAAHSLPTVRGGSLSAVKSIDPTTSQQQQQQQQQGKNPLHHAHSFSSLSSPFLNPVFVSYDTFNNNDNPNNRNNPNNPPGLVNTFTSRSSMQLARGLGGISALTRQGDNNNLYPPGGYPQNASFSLSSSGGRLPPITSPNQSMDDDDDDDDDEDRIVVNVELKFQNTKDGTLNDAPHESLTDVIRTMDKNVLSQSMKSKAISPPVTQQQQQQQQQQRDSHAVITSITTGRNSLLRNRFSSSNQSNNNNTVVDKSYPNTTEPTLRKSLLQEMELPVTRESELIPRNTDQSETNKPRLTGITLDGSISDHELLKTMESRPTNTTTYSEGIEGLPEEEENNRKSENPIESTIASFTYLWKSLFCTCWMNQEELELFELPPTRYEIAAVLIQFARDGEEQHILYTRFAFNCYKLRHKHSRIFQFLSFCLLVLRFFERPLWSYSTSDWSNIHIYPSFGMYLFSTQLMCGLKFPIFCFLFLGLLLELGYKEKSLKNFLWCLWKTIEYYCWNTYVTISDESSSVFFASRKSILSLLTGNYYQNDNENELDQDRLSRSSSLHHHQHQRNTSFMTPNHSGKYYQPPATTSRKNSLGPRSRDPSISQPQQSLRRSSSFHQGGNLSFSNYLNGNDGDTSTVMGAMGGNDNAGQAEAFDLVTFSRGFRVFLTFHVISLIFVLLFVIFTNFMILPELVTITSAGSVLFFLWFNRRTLQKLKIISAILPKFFIIITLLAIFILIIAGFGPLIFHLENHHDDDYNISTNTNDDDATIYFKNIPNSIWSIFVAITSSSWPNQIMPAYHSYREVAIYFITFITIGSFGLLNLIIVLIFIEFQKSLQSALDRHKITKEILLIKAFEILDIDEKDYLEYEEVSLLCDEIFTNYSNFTKIGLSQSTIRQLLIEILDIDGDEKISLTDFLYFLDVMRMKLSFVTKYNIIESHRQYLLRQNNHYPNRLQKRKQQRTWGSWCLDMIFMIIPLDILIFIERHYVKNRVLDLVTDSIGLFFFILNFSLNGIHQLFDPNYLSILFMLITLTFYLHEMALKILFRGFTDYIRSYRNRFDFFSTIIFALSIFIDSANHLLYENDVWTYIMKIAYLLRIFMYPRNIRLFFYSNPDIKKISKLLRRIFVKLYTLAMVFFCISYVYANIGMFLYGGKINKQSNNQHFMNSQFVLNDFWAINFNDMMSSISTLFICLHVSDFDIVTSGYTSSTTNYSRIFFAAWYVIGVLFMLNVLKSFFLGEFLSLFINPMESLPSFQLVNENKVKKNHRNSMSVNAKNKGEGGDDQLAADPTGLDELSELERKKLMENHWISKQHLMNENLRQRLIQRLNNSLLSSKIHIGEDGTRRNNPYTDIDTFEDDEDDDDDDAVADEYNRRNSAAAAAAHIRRKSSNVEGMTTMDRRNSEGLATIQEEFQKKTSPTNQQHQSIVRESDSSSSNKNHSFSTSSSSNKINLKAANLAFFQPTGFNNNETNLNPAGGEEKQTSSNIPIKSMKSGEDVLTDSYYQHQYPPGPGNLSAIPSAAASMDTTDMQLISEVSTPKIITVQDSSYFREVDAFEGNDVPIARENESTLNNPNHPQADNQVEGINQNNLAESPADNNTIVVSSLQTKGLDAHGEEVIRNRLRRLSVNLATSNK